MFKWRHFHRESKQKDHVYGIPEKGRYSPCLAPPTRHEWCFLGNRARGWPWKKLLHSSFYFTKRKGPLFSSQCTGPGEPPRIPGSVWTPLLRGRGEATLQQNLSPAGVSGHRSPQAWSPHPLTASPLPFLSGRCSCLKQFESFDSLLRTWQKPEREKKQLCLP